MAARSETEECVRVDDFIVRRIPMRSGRVLLDAWQEWPEEEPLPKEHAAFRDEEGYWYKSIPVRRAHVLVRQAFPDSVVGGYRRRWGAFEEIPS